MQSRDAAEQQSEPVESWKLQKQKRKKTTVAQQQIWPGQKEKPVWQPSWREQSKKENLEPNMQMSKKLTYQKWWCVVVIWSSSNLEVKVILFI